MVQLQASQVPCQRAMSQLLLRLKDRSSLSRLSPLTSGSVLRFSICIRSRGKQVLRSDVETGSTLACLRYLQPAWITSRTVRPSGITHRGFLDNSCHAQVWEVSSWWAKFEGRVEGGALWLCILLLWLGCLIRGDLSQVALSESKQGRIVGLVHIGYELWGGDVNVEVRGRRRLLLALEDDEAIVAWLHKGLPAMHANQSSDGAKGGTQRFTDGHLKQKVAGACWGSNMEKT